MKKNMTKIVSLALVLVFVLMLGGCGANDKQALVGTWKGTMDLTQMMNDELASSMEADMAEYIKISSFKFTMVVTFNGDGTYSMKLDESSLDQTINTLKADLKSGLEAYLTQMLKDEGLDMSLDEVLALSNTSLDEMMEESLPTESFLEMFDDVAEEGKYDAKGGKLYLTTSDGETSYDNYTLNGSTLTLLDTTDDNADPVMKAIYPMVFHKAS